MVLWLMVELRAYFPPLRVFQYVSFRVIAAMLTAAGQLRPLSDRVAPELAARLLDRLPTVPRAEAVR